MSQITLFAMIHIIGAITTIIIHCKNGIMEAAIKYGDGIRLARPSDVILMDCTIWEILILIRILDNVSYYINRKFEEYFDQNEDNK